MLAFALPLLIAACDLGRVFDSPAGWSADAGAFERKLQAEGFRYTDSSQTVLNGLGRGRCTWHKLDVWEARLYFGPERKVERVELSLYNRGDDTSGQGIGAEALDRLLAAATAAAAGPDGKSGGAIERRKLKSGGYRCSRCFEKAACDIELVWGVDSAKAKDLTADYVKVTLAPKGAPGKSARAQAKAKPQDNVRRNAQGDVWIDGVPMVDQGAKGYCAAAVAERVLRYFGATVDEHEFAQMAKTTAGGGTLVKDMIAAVKALASRNRLAYQEIVSLGSSRQEIEKDIEQYNKAAKRLRKSEVSLEGCYVGSTLMLNLVREKFEPDVLLAMRVKDGRYRRFLTLVKAQIDKGVPVLWGVTLGLYPEPGLPQSGGGHMRLIIGYNAKTHEILYSDTWGAGHELKRMGEDKAFAMTHDAFFLRPLF